MSDGTTFERREKDARNAPNGDILLDESVRLDQSMVSKRAIPPMIIREKECMEKHLRTNKENYFSTMGESPENGLRSLCPVLQLHGKPRSP